MFLQKKNPKIFGQIPKVGNYEHNLCILNREKNFNSFDSLPIIYFFWSVQFYSDLCLRPYNQTRGGGNQSKIFSLSLQKLMTDVDIIIILDNFPPWNLLGSFSTYFLTTLEIVHVGKAWI